MRIIDTNIIFAVRCKNCGKIRFHSLSVFELQKKGVIQCVCECNNTALTVTLKRGKSIIMNIPCIACDISHTYRYNLKDVIKRPVTVLCCNDTGFELCFLGDGKEVKDIVCKYQENLNRLLGELGLFDDIEGDLLKPLNK